MKNLKKVLALVLVVVMALGLITVSNAAFSDEATIEKKEAVDVLTAIGVINGQPDGSFQPEGDVTRAQMAKMIAIIMNEGKDEVNDLYKDACKFTDSANNWAAGYIAYCAQAGIINGKSETTFDPEGKVTGTEAAKMLLCALGYKADAQGYIGANWAAAVLSDASKSNLVGSDYNLTVTMNAPLDRQNAAQMILNALKANMKDYEDNGTKIEGSGFTITTSAKVVNVKKEIPASAPSNRYGKIVDDGIATNDSTGALLYTTYTVQLGEAKFEKLELDRSAGSRADAFQRPAVTWKYDGKEITKVADKPILTYKDQVKGGTLYADLGKVKVYPTAAAGTPLPADAATLYKVNYYIDGETAYDTTITGTTYVAAVRTGFTPAADVAAFLVSGNNADFGRIGDVIDVYKNVDTKTITIVQANYHTALLQNVVDQKLSPAGDLQRVAYVQLDSFTSSVQPDVSDGQQIPAGAFETTAFTTADIGTRVIYTAAGTTSTNKTLQSVAKAETATGLFTTSKSNISNEYELVTIAGTDYTVQAGISNTSASQNENATIYLDPNGNVAAIEGEAFSNFAFLIDQGTGNATFGDGKPYGRLVFTDGTVKEVELSASILNTTTTPASYVGTDGLYSYTVNNKDVYTLTAVPTTVAATAIKGTKVANNNLTVNTAAARGKIAYFSGTNFVGVDDDTKFIVETYDKANNTAVYTVYEGLKNLPALSAVDDYAAWTTTSSVGYTTTNPEKVAGDSGSNIAAVSVSVKKDSTTTTLDNASVVYIFGAKLAAASSKDVTALFMVGNDPKTKEADNTEYYTVDAVVNGTATKVKLATGDHTGTMPKLVVANSLNVENDIISSPSEDTTLVKDYGPFTQSNINGYVGKYSAGIISLTTTAATPVTTTLSVDASVPVYVYNVNSGEINTTTIGSYVPAGDPTATGFANTDTVKVVYDLDPTVAANVNTAKIIGIYVIETH